VIRDTVRASRATEVLEAHREFLLSAVRLCYEDPFVLEEGRGGAGCGTRAVASIWTGSGASSR